MTPGEAGRIVLERVGWLDGAIDDLGGPYRVAVHRGVPVVLCDPYDNEWEEPIGVPDLTDHATQGVYLGWLRERGCEIRLERAVARIRTPGIPYPRWLPIHEAIARAVMAVTE